MRLARYNWAKKHEHQILEDWKKVIWTDEISVILGHRRGAVRIWRKIEERFDNTVIRRRQKDSSEFIFQGSFSYNHKGPLYIQKTETATQKKAATEALERRNKEIEPKAKSA